MEFKVHLAPGSEFIIEDKYFFLQARRTIEHFDVVNAVGLVYTFMWQFDTFMSFGNSFVKEFQLQLMENCTSIQRNSERPSIVLHKLDSPFSSL